MNEPPRSARPYRMDARARAAAETGRRILDAAVSLFDELLYDQMTLTDVAARAGVTVQTVLRRFGAKDELFAAVARDRSPVARRERDTATVGDVGRAVAALAEDYERVGRHTLHLLAQERRTEAIAAVVEAGRRYHRDWVAHVFAPQLDILDPGTRQLRHAQLVAVTDLYTWKVLREDMALDADRARAALASLVERILG